MFTSWRFLCPTGSINTRDNASFLPGFFVLNLPFFFLTLGPAVGGDRTVARLEFVVICFLIRVVEACCRLEVFRFKPNERFRCELALFAGKLVTGYLLRGWPLFVQCVALDTIRGMLPWPPSLLDFYRSSIASCLCVCLATCSKCSRLRRVYQLHG